MTEPQDTRAAFEQAMWDIHTWEPELFRRGSEGQYVHVGTQFAWVGWQAHADAANGVKVAATLHIFVADGRREISVTPHQAAAELPLGDHDLYVAAGVRGTYKDVTEGGQG